MAKRRTVPPYLTLPDEALRTEPADGWELLVDGQPDRIVRDKDLFPSWDSSLKFSLRRRFSFDVNEFSEFLSIPPDQATYQLVARLETARGLLSQVAFKALLDANDSEVEVEIKPDSRQLSRDVTIACSVVIAETQGDLDVLAPSNVGSRVWSQVWSAKLEGGRVRLPIEVTSFSKQLYSLGIPNALFHVSVADDPALEFEQAVCVYLNSDHRHFVSDFEKGERSATAMVWDAVVRQTLSAGLSMVSSDGEEGFPEGSIGAQLDSWVASIFPGESSKSIVSIWQENPAVFEGRIQSWINAGELWAGGKS